MQVNLSGHHIEISPTLRENVHDKLTRIERHFHHVTDIHYILTIEKLRHKVEATVNVSDSQLYADSVESDTYAAIGTLTDKLDHQVKKHKEKLSNHHPKGSGKRDFS